MTIMLLRMRLRHHFTGVNNDKMCPRTVEIVAAFGNVDGNDHMLRQKTFKYNVWKI